MPARLDIEQKDANGVRAVIVDRDEFSRRHLRSMLASHRDVEVVGEAATAAEARHRIAELQPDLLLMDVEIPGGNSIELLRELEPLPYVIFVAAHSEFALPAFELRAVDYLVKPVQGPRFAESINRARRRVAEGRIADLAMRIASAASSLVGSSGVASRAMPATYPEQITIRVRRRMFWVDVGDIVWIQGASQYSRVHTKHGEYLLSRTLSSMECELDPRRFFRIHRSAIVNAAHVTEIRSTGDGRYNIYLRGGPALPLGRSRREILRKLAEGVRD